MFFLTKGKYTGRIAESINIDGNIISTTHYSDVESNCDWHFHENPHISFVFQGGDSESLCRYSNERGDDGIFFYHAGEKHRWISPTPISKSANIEIGDAFSAKYELEESDVQKAVMNNLDAKFLILKMQQEMLFSDKDSFASIQTLLLDLFSQSRGRFEGVEPKWVGVLSELLNDRWNEQLTLPELAECADVHPVTISRYFRRYFNSTLGEYRRKLKIDKSISLVKKQELSLTEIAFLCGFADQSHFTRNFKQITGFLPSEFRKF